MCLKYVMMFYWYTLCSHCTLCRLRVINTLSTRLGVYSHTFCGLLHHVTDYVMTLAYSYTTQYIMHQMSVVTYIYIYVWNYICIILCMICNNEVYVHNGIMAYMAVLCMICMLFIYYICFICCMSFTSRRPQFTTPVNFGKQIYC